MSAASSYDGSSRFCKPNLSVSANAASVYSVVKNIEWIRVPAGGPVERDFEIAKYPVTNAQYAEYLQAIEPAEAAKRYCRLMEEHFFGGIMKDYSPKPGFEKKPVVFVSWYDAQTFAKWAGGRLPTAAEWRKAAAWLPTENRHAKYCTGEDELPTQSNAVFYDDDNGWALPAPHLADVDWYRPAGAYGLCGMAGNVAEWVDSEMSNDWKLALGGSLFRPVEQTLTDSSEGDAPEKRLSTFGFRICRRCSV